jgi:hypothetical protein
MKNIIMVALCLSITMATWTQASTFTPLCGEDLAIPSGKSLSIPSVDDIAQGVAEVDLGSSPDVGTDYDDIVYSREDLKEFLKILKKTYTYDQIIGISKIPYRKHVIQKLSLDDTYGLTKDYSDAWDGLRNTFDLQYKALLESKGIFPPMNDHDIKDYLGSKYITYTGKLPSIDEKTHQNICIFRLICPEVHMETTGKILVHGKNPWGKGHLKGKAIKIDGLIETHGDLFLDSGFVQGRSRVKKIPPTS